MWFFVDFTFLFQLPYEKRANRYRKLDHITAWARVNNKKNANNPTFADETILFTT